MGGPYRCAATASCSPAPPPASVAWGGGSGERKLVNLGRRGAGGEARPGLGDLRRSRSRGAAGVHLQTTSVYLMPAYVWRHGGVHDLCMYRLLSVHTRVSHPPRLLRVYPLGRVCNSAGIRPGGVYMRSLCVPAHACVYPTRVCPHKPAVPVPRAPVGFTPEHRTHGRGVRRRPPPPARCRVGGTPPARLPFPAGRRAVRGGTTGVLPSPPGFSLKGEQLCRPCEKGRRNSLPRASGRGKSIRGENPPSAGGGGTSRVLSPTQNPRTALMRRGERGKRPSSPGCRFG